MNKPAITIYWFGFSADPPTLAHQRIIKALERLPKKKEIGVFPAGPLSYKKFTAPKKHREAMVKAWWKAAKFGENVHLAWFDWHSEKAWSWYRLWKKIQRLTPQ